MKMRYDATSYPSPTEKESLDNESITQWLFEVAFFRDFVYRNPDKKPGKEFSDALIIYDDTVIIVQNKTKLSERNDLYWAKNNISGALSQLKGSYRNISNKLVTQFRNELLRIAVTIDEKKHRSIYGMVILAQDSEPYDPLSLVEKNEMPSIPFIVCSLNDLKIIADRMDTAIDFVTYFESRIETQKSGVTLLVNDELENMKKIGNSLHGIYSRNLKSTKKEIIDRTVQLKKIQMEHGLRRREDYKFSLLIDDIIGCAHDIDTEFTESTRKNDSRIPQIYGNLDRYRRIELGKRLYTAAIAAQKSIVEIIVHIQKPIERVFVYVYTSIDRKARKKYLEALVAISQIKYSLVKVTAVATEPVGMGGRSYDFFSTDEMLVERNIDIPKDVLETLPDIGDQRLI